MNRVRIAVGLGIGILLGMCSMAVGAQTKQQVKDDMCYPTQVIANYLRDIYGERRVRYTTRADGLMFEIYSSTKKNTWTSTTVFPNSGMAGEDIACITDFGDNS
jgi:hypothetical protein